MKALFTYNYGEEKMKMIENLGYEIIFKHERDIKFESFMKDVEILVCYNPFRTLDITKIPNLKWIQLSSIGVDQAPREYIINNDIKLTNNKGGYSIPMGEWIVMKTLEMIKNSRKMYERQRKKEWKIDTTILELFGKTIGFIGTGSIAKEGAKRLQGFGVNIIGLNTSGRDTEYFHKCYPKEKLEDMVSLCDIVVLTIPYTKETHHMINEKVFDKMKDGVYIINVSRGSIIDENAMINYLNSGKIGGAALDVFEKEPLCIESPLWNISNVILTPHNSWVSEMRNERRFYMIYENMKRYKNGEDLLNVVDLNRGY